MRRTTISHFSFLISHSIETFKRNQGASRPQRLTQNHKPINHFNQGVFSMLTGKQKQYLKALAVQLPAVVQIGKDGMSETVIQSVDDVLTARELIKVKINQNSDEDIKSTAFYLAGHLSCEIVQIIGRNCVLFKKKEKKSHYELP